MTWQELDEGVWVRRYDDPFDQNIGLVLGETGALLVDSRANPSYGRELRDEITKLTDLPIGWLFNTHHHWDHTFGNQVFGEARIWGHVDCRRTLLENGEAVLKALGVDYGESAFAEVEITPPTEVFTESATIELGNRTVELAYYGRGHTNNDAVLHVGAVTFAGDLVEEGNPPSVDDSFPIDWVETIGVLAEAARERIVPGHGSVVDAEYLVVARFDLSWIARTAEAAHREGRPVPDIDLSDAPYPEATARAALERAYSELDSKFSQ